jgi:hypothetical protein
MLGRRKTDSPILRVAFSLGWECSAAAAPADLGTPTRLGNGASRDDSAELEESGQVLRTGLTKISSRISLTARPDEYEWHSEVDVSWRGSG